MASSSTSSTVVAVSSVVVALSSAIAAGVYLLRTSTRKTTTVRIAIQSDLSPSKVGVWLGWRGRQGTVQLGMCALPGPRNHTLCRPPSQAVRCISLRTSTLRSRWFAAAAAGAAMGQNWEEARHQFPALLTLSRWG